MYQHADYLWALSDEIAEIYRRDISIENEKILLCGNCIIKPSLNLETKSAQKLCIGVIGKITRKRIFLY